jgi:hypothetical protein
MRLADLPSRLHEFDVVVSSTASQLPIIGLGAVERALKARKHRPMFMVDLAVPRDIEPEVKALEDVYLYTVDDLAHVVQTGQPTAGRGGAGRGHHRRRRAELRALDGPAQRGAADPAAQSQATSGAAGTGARPQAAGQGRGRRRGAGGALARPHAEDAARRDGRTARRRRRVAPARQPRRSSTSSCAKSVSGLRARVMPGSTGIHRPAAPDCGPARNRHPFR